MPNHRKRPTGGIQAEDDALVGSARIVPLPPEKLHRARRVVAGRAVDHIERLHGIDVDEHLLGRIAVRTETVEVLAALGLIEGAR